MMTRSPLLQLDPIISLHMKNLVPDFENAGSVYSNWARRALIL